MAIARLLMSAGADIHIKDKKGGKAGDYATSGGHDDVLEFIANFKKQP